MSKKITLTVKQTHSIANTTKKQQACVRGLGLRRIGMTRTLEDTPAVRGMINKVPFLVEVVEG